MTDSTVLDAFRGMTFFQGLAEEQLQRLAAIARPAEFPANSAIFRQHDHAKDVFVVVSGQVSLVICEPKVGCRQLMQVGDGEMIGWSPLVGRPRLSDTARTMTPTKVLAMDGEQILALCAEDPKFGFEFMHRIAMGLASRLSATRLQLLDMGGFQLPDVQIESD